MTAITIRRATATDLPALHELLTYLHNGPPWFADEQQRAADALRSITDDPNRALLLAERDGRIVGTVDIATTINLTRHVSPFGIVENIVVMPDARRGGIGRALIAAALQFALTQGCYKVQLVSANTRGAAQDLYASMGFDADVSGYRRYLTAVDHKREAPIANNSEWSTSESKGDGAPGQST